MEKVYFKAVDNGVAYVPGKFFYTDTNEGIETMRLNFTNIDEETIEKGIRILAEVLKKEI